MPKIAYLLLCHEDPDAIIEQARYLTKSGNYIAIHFDRRSPTTAYRKIRNALADIPNAALCRKRVKCAWGGWSLVQATLNMLRTGLAVFPDATHFYLISGSCMPIKPAAYAHDFLGRRNVDYIESFDYFTSTWIKQGQREDRLIYRHFFNQRKQLWAFDTSLALQKWLGLSREIPKDLQMQIGSQWWCLRRSTVEKILVFIRRRWDIKWFFKTTWIPDETFFQTLARHLVPAVQIETRSPTFLIFSVYSLPVSFYNDHYDLLRDQEYLFARKISPDATGLKSRLTALYLSPPRDFPVSHDGLYVYNFTTLQGRLGQRHGQQHGARFWEQQSTIGQNRELLVVICQRRHVAQRLVSQINRLTDINAFAYLFNDLTVTLPDLGGIEDSLSKRNRHRKALLRLVFDSTHANRMMICLDPEDIDLIKDFCAESPSTRLLQIDCELTDRYLTDHAIALDLIAAKSPQGAVRRLLPRLRAKILQDRAILELAGFDNHYRIADQADINDTADTLSRFLALPAHTLRADELAEDLFSNEDAHVL